MKIIILVLRDRFTDLLYKRKSLCVSKDLFNYLSIFGILPEFLLPLDPME